MKKLPVLDLETKSISDHPRPGSPPPVGLAIMFPGKAPQYLAWGHPINNGVYTLKGEKLVKAASSTDPESAAKKMIKDAYKLGVLGHNIAKFDVPVIEDHLGIAPPKWDKVHDTLFSLFLRDPHSTSLSLKPAAERWCGVAPEERDAVYEWLAAKGIIPKPRMEKGRPKYAKDAGGQIWRAPGDLVGLYAIGDLTRTQALHEIHMPWVTKHGMQGAYDRERELAPILLENERQGVRVDMEALARLLPGFRNDLSRAEEWIRKRLKVKDSDFYNKTENRYGFNLDSDAHIAQALRQAKVVKHFPKTATGKDSVSKKNLTIEHYEDPKVYYAIQYWNTLSTVLTQSLEKWYAEGSKKNGYVYREWNQVRQAHGEDNAAKGARSGRITVSGFANIAKRIGAKDPNYKHPDFMKVGEPPMARDFILPDEGEEFGHSDFDQQEMKITAHYEDGALADQYRKEPKTDIHVFVHDLIEHVSGKDYIRDIVKIVDFRTSYGGGVSGLAEQLRIPYNEAKEIIDNWKKALPDVVELDRSLKALFKEGKAIRTLGGRLYFCKPPAVAKKGPRKGMMISFEYTALNYLIQPSAADQTKQAIINYHNDPRRQGRMLVTVYDEINITMKDRRELQVLQDAMVNAFKLDVPVTTTLKAGPSWGKVQKIEAQEKAA